MFSLESPNELNRILEQSFPRELDQDIHWQLAMIILTLGFLELQNLEC